MFEITHPETNRTFIFGSEDAHDTAEKWYNSTTKTDIVAFCAERGLELSETKDTLIEDWALAAMELYAQVVKG